MLSAMLAIACIGAIVLAWHASLEARETANEIAADTCQRAGVQLLEDTVFFQSLRFVRSRGGLALRRTYIFEYSDDGERRRRGFVVLLGRDLETVGLGPRSVN